MTENTEISGKYGKYTGNMQQMMNDYAHSVLDMMGVILMNRLLQDDSYSEDMHIYALKTKAKLVI